LNFHDIDAGRVIALEVALRPALLVLPLALALAVAATSHADDAAPPLPAAKDFSKLVMEIAKSYPTDGTHKYYWPKGGSWPGTTRDLFYGDTKIAEGDPEKRCYCCGITFEVFFRAYEKYCKDAKKPFKILDLDAKGVKDLRHEWFGPTEKDRKTVVTAVTKFKLGKEIKLADAREGDFCQLWRHSGNGHSVIVLEVEKDSEGKPTALKYWSTQGSTNGIHENTEKFSDAKSGVIAGETYVARVGKD
jgi:hypothetical protein